jgi:hypothetical protein
LNSYDAGQRKAILPRLRLATALLGALAISGASLLSPAMAAQVGGSGNSTHQLALATEKPVRGVAIERLPGRTPSEELVIYKRPEKPAPAPVAGEDKRADSTGKADEKSAGQGKSADKPLEKPGDKPVEKAGDKPSDKSSEKPVDASTSNEKPVGAGHAVGRGAAKSSMTSSRSSTNADRAATRKQAAAGQAKNQQASKTGEKSAVRKAQARSGKPVKQGEKRVASTRKPAGTSTGAGKESKQVGSSGSGTTGSAGARPPADPGNRPVDQLPPIIERSLDNSR